MIPEWLLSHPRGTRILVHAQPGARKSGIAGLHGDSPPRLKLKLHAPAVDGKANEALIAFFSALFGIPCSRTHLLRGEKSREKEVLLEGVDPTEAALVLNPALERLTKD